MERILGLKEKFEQQNHWAEVGFSFIFLSPPASPLSQLRRREQKKQVSDFKDYFEERAKVWKEGFLSLWWKFERFRWQCLICRISFPLHCWFHPFNPFTQGWGKVCQRPWTTRKRLFGENAKRSSRVGGRGPPGGDAEMIDNRKTKTLWYSGLPETFSLVLWMRQTRRLSSTPASPRFNISVNRINRYSFFLSSKETIFDTT